MFETNEKSLSKEIVYIKNKQMRILEVKHTIMENFKKFNGWVQQQKWTGHRKESINLKIEQ